MRSAASLDGVDVVGKVVAEDAALARAVPPLLPHEVAALLNRKVLLPRVVDPHDHHAVDAWQEIQNNIILIDSLMQSC